MFDWLVNKVPPIKRVRDARAAKAAAGFARAEAALAAAGRLMEELAEPCAYLLPVGRAPDHPWASQICGPAWIGAGQEWPQGADGRPMLHLVQINCADLPELPGFPDRGLLQVFVDDGAECPTADPDKVHLRFTAKAGEGERMARPAPAGRLVPRISRDLLTKGTALTFEAGRMRPSGSDFRLADLVWDRQLRGPAERLVEDFTDALDAERRHPVYLGGHPQFAQYDIRADEAFAEFTKGLLQIGPIDGLEWGDGGEVAFLMRPQDFAAWDFSRVLFTWDCS